MPEGAQVDPAGRIAPVLRGLLSEPTGNADRPYQPVILERVAGGGIKASARGGKGRGRGVALEVEGLKDGESDEDLRARLSAAVERFEKEHKARPGYISIAGTELFQVVRQAENSAGGKELAGRTAIVTGAAGAIGYGICEGLLKQGCHVAITDLPGVKLDEFAGEFAKRHSGSVIGVAMDVSDPASVARGFGEVSAKWGGVDIVVINAGIAATGPLTGLDLEAFRRLERVNVEGTLLALAEAGRQFARQNIGGDVILISTKNVFAPGAGFGAYSATKAAAHQLARIASLEFAPMGVRVNMVAPDAVFSGGAHKSGLWAEVGPGRMKARGLDEKGLEEYYRNRNLLKARVTAEHVANAVLFFALRKTPTTGACIPVDGGLPDATPR
jgi:NAD(P)-dependent dehydrogenase (short-subunit alcohol dehydrogenase family)